MRTISYGLLLISVFAPSAYAGILYGTSFETPTFSTGPIAGQDGWAVFGPGAIAVESSFAKTGSQAVFVNGGSDTQSGPYHTDANVGPLIELSADIAIFTSSTQSGFQFAAVGPGLSGYLGGIDILPNNSIQAISGAFPVIGTFTRATAFDSTAWHHVDLLFNLATQTYDITIDGTALATGLAFCGTNVGCNGAHVGTFSDSYFNNIGVFEANDSAYIDNLEVASLDPAPEPSTVLLFAAGLAFVAARRRQLA